jgi:energy-coupling factor transporter ATP-binding protein EcfA2
MLTETKFQLTQDQEHALLKIQAFIQSDSQAFILCGYAGTGKTTLLRLLNEQLREIGRQVTLLAPTGRAAKILREKTGLDASTVHSGIYNYQDLKEVKVADEEDADSFRYFFALKPNDNLKNQVFIVDESSMISDDLSEGEFFQFGSGKLLSDLIDFTRIQHSLSGNKLIFVGDPAQLAPPTNSNYSPALSATFLLEKFGLTTDSFTMSQVIRQEAGSGILSTAERIRKSIDSGYFNHFEIPPNPQDIHAVVQDAFYQMYDTASGRKIVITYTNQTAHQINMDIRRHKHGGEYPVRVGDVMLVGQNNHLTGLFNGEFGIINRFEEHLVSREVAFKVAGGATARALLKWRKIELAAQDSNGFKPVVDTYMLENYLYSKVNTLKPEEQQALYVDFKNRHQHLKPGSIEFKEALRSDPFFNALRLKYGFAVTCHKAQGGEWDSAFVFWDYGRPANFDVWKEKQEKTGRNNADFYRWAYTAITRASENLYCINSPAFTPYDHLAFLSPGALPGVQHLNGASPSIFTFEAGQDTLDNMLRLGVPQHSAAIRNHFLSVLYQCRLANIEITAWKQNGYEFTYYFLRGADTASVKGWVKANNSFSPTYQKNPGSTNSDELFTMVQRMCQENNRFQAVLPQQEGSIPAQLALDWSVAEQKPFLHHLYLGLQDALNSHRISIGLLEHLNYKDRYTFERLGEKVVLDVEYDGQGFFGRVVPLINPTPSALLLRDLETIFLSLKNR